MNNESLQLKNTFEWSMIYCMSRTTKRTQDWNIHTFILVLLLTYSYLVLFQLSLMNLSGFNTLALARIILSYKLPNALFYLMMYLLRFVIFIANFSRSMYWKKSNVSYLTRTRTFWISVKRARLYIIGTKNHLWVLLSVFNFIMWFK